MDHFEDPAGSEVAYRRGVEMGDARSAFNLHVLFLTEGRLDEARDALRVARNMGDATFPLAEVELRWARRRREV